MASDVFALTGQVLDGHYRVDAVIGEGGFAIVYRGYHLTFEHAVAIKCLKLPPHFTAEARALFLQQFRAEGAMLSRLSDHPSITRVFAFGVVRGPQGVEIPYLVLEWLEGHTLEAELRQRGAAFSEAEAEALLRPAIDAISFAHDEKIAHRDLKPANLFLATTRRGVVMKVLDFGIAKAMQDGESATQMMSRTSSGFSAFSPLYGAPEQFRPKRYGATGPWTDVHSLGLVLTEMLTGKQPYDGDEAADFLEAATSTSRPTPRTRGGACSDKLEALCRRALALTPAERFSNAGEMLAVLNGTSVEPFDARSATTNATPIPAAFQPLPAVAVRTEIASAQTVIPQRPRASKSSPVIGLPLALAGIAAVAIGGILLGRFVFTGSPEQRAETVAPPTFRDEVVAPPKKASDARAELPERRPEPPAPDPILPKPRLIPEPVEPPTKKLVAPIDEEQPRSRGAAPNDGDDVERPVLAPNDETFVDRKGGWGWSDRCFLHYKADKLGWALAACQKGMSLDPASPTPRAPLLYNLGLIAQKSRQYATARQYFLASLDIREHPEVRAALESLP